MVKTNLSREEITQRAIQYLGPKDYKLISKSDTHLIFEGSRDINAWIFVLALLFFLIGAVLYYFASTKHAITFSMTDTEDGIDVQTTTTTSKSMLLAVDFLNTL